MTRPLVCGTRRPPLQVKFASLNHGTWFAIVALDLQGAFAEAVSKAAWLSTARSRQCRSTFRPCPAARRQDRPDALPHALAAPCRGYLVLRDQLAPGPGSRRLRILS